MDSGAGAGAGSFGELDAADQISSAGEQKRARALLCVTGFETRPHTSSMYNL